MRVGDSAPPNVADLLADLREEIRQRRAHLVANSPIGPYARSLAELRRSVETVNELWLVTAQQPINWHLRIVGRLGAYAKRLVRRSLRWYIVPIVEQQNRFNGAAARAVTAVQAYHERMTRDALLLEEHVAQLEQQARGE